ncbi:hypothetical protein WS90_25055 [Burkholderia cepacia]|uniref:Methyl-accepting chemotaxis protein n=1 Tax=Burkholderia cepacia TaxID=292 RepID=A0A103Z9Z4_BURCE|nr:methyl-accepting chemotaxis protein [Burkholderia cepacia]KVK75921.1 hypothetical protein WS90_25055 [Burkholderia cepacia]
MQGMTKSIKFKIVLMFGLCVAVVAILGGFGLYGLSRLNTSMGDAFNNNTMPISNLSDVRVEVSNIRLQLRRMQVYRDPAMTKQAVELIRNASQHIDVAWHQYYPAGVTSSDERAIADQIDRALPQFNAWTNEAIPLLEAGNYDAASPILDKMGKLGETINTLLRNDADNNVVHAKQAIVDGESLYRMVFMITAALIGAGLLIAIGASAYLLQAIDKPLAQAVSVADAIAAGRLENRIAVESRDEFGLLLDALRKMDCRLGETVRGIRLSAESVTAASQEIASGNTDLSARTEEQAASLEETAASMTQLTETVKQNADNARQANALATRATDLADSGNDAVLGMVSTIERISGSSSKISDITGVIEGIAFQTNILALNAAVEAARAGEQGRGFAVVASEVRSLAQRSAGAAKEIKELIGSSVAMIESGAKQATEVGATMGHVKQSIKQVSDIVAEIAAASDEQSRGIEQIHQAVSQMDEVTQQNAALVEQAAAAAQALEEQARHLNSAVSVFELNDTRVPSLSASAVQPSVAAKKVLRVQRIDAAPPLAEANHARETF